MTERYTTRVIALAVLVVAAGSSACAAKVGSTEAGAQAVSVTVEPNSAALVVNQAAQFAAIVTGAVDVSVTWQVEEAGGGTVDQTGLYTAPGAAGSYHVRAVNVSSGVSAAATVTVTVPATGSVAISPRTASVTAGGTVTFTATVTNLTTTGVVWSVLEPSGCGSVTSAGVYTAPSAAGTCHVVATSTADSSKSDTATVTVTPPVAVTVTPASGTVDACKTLSFSATVSGSSDQSVTWSVAEGSSGGSVSTGGVYTAPSTAGTYHVVATSHASASATARATVTVQDHILSIAISPATASLSTGGTQQFTATVTTSCGTFLATQ
ncbi:MAG TPA: hypothetical protein VMU15_16860 [Anaeromyxobacter sp.]|nr:hypothetical protein [Anaeromyxobacter sp.]